MWVRSLVLLRGLRIPHCHELWYRSDPGELGSDPKLLWLWRRPVATAPIPPLAWGPLYAAGAAHEIAKRQKKKKKKSPTLWAPCQSQCPD